MSKPWYLQKTTWTCITALLGIVGTVVAGEVTLAEGFGAALLFLSQIFQRQAHNK